MDETQLVGLDKVDAATELLRRRKARNNLYDFAQYCNKEYLDAKHLRKISQVLEQVERGEIKRVIISCPPRFGKSLLCSVNFPAWYLGKHPKNRVVITGYGESIASVNSRLCRELFYTDEYDKIFPGLHKKNSVIQLQKSAKEWRTRSGGGLYAVGIGGGLTGRGANIAIIDDYLKERKDADSEVMRQRVEDWYKSVLYTRLEPDGAIIIISTRWHLQDLIGSLLEEMEGDGDQWEVINLQAIYKEDGEEKSLWPARYPIDVLKQTRAVEGRHEWSALYMGDPFYKGGQIFNTDNIVFEDKLDLWPDKKHFRCWDLASSQKQRSKNNPDATVGVLGCVTEIDGLKHLWIKDAKMIREEAPRRNALITECAKADGENVSVYIEAFGAYKDAYLELKKILMGVRIVRASRLSGDKRVKASPMEALFEAHHVHVLKGSWNDDYLKDFSTFPMGAHDDAVDATAILYHEQTKPSSGIIMIN